MSEQDVLSHAQPKHSGIGISSFVVSIAAAVLMFVAFAVAGEMEVSTSGGIDEDSAEATLVGIAIIGLLVADLVALGLGIGGLYQKAKKKIFPILGIVFSSAVIVASVALLIVGAVVG